MNKSLLWLMAISCGLTAGANYFCQPLIHSIQHDFNTTTAQAQLTVTIAQISYALGLLFIVPTGDLVNKTKLIPSLMCLAGIGLLICATSVNLPMLWLGTAMAGLFSVAAQVLIPFSTMMVAQNKIGETVGFLMSGLLIGILLSTTLSGLISNLFHWKVIYILSACCIFTCAFLLKIRLPNIPSTLQLSYGGILSSMRTLFVEEKRLVVRSLLGASAFATMSLLFSTMSTYLSQPPFSLKDAFIGMVSLVGIIGALSTQFVGKWGDRGYNALLTFVGCGLLFLGWLSLLFSPQHLSFYLIGFAVLNTGLAFHHSCNQNIIYRLRPEAKSRINAIYMTFYFGGAATGSALGVFAWNHGGWSSVCIAGFSLVSATIICACLDYAKWGAQLKSSV